MEEMKDIFIGLFTTIFLVGLGCIAAWLVVDIILQTMASWVVEGIGKVEFYD